MSKTYLKKSKPIKAVVAATATAAKPPPPPPRRHNRRHENGNFKMRGGEKATQIKP
jgi:hypothetical protein